MTIGIASSCRSASFLRIALLSALAVSAAVDGYAQVAHAGRNVNMASGTTLPDGDPWLQRQSELSVACSSRDSLACLAVGNDYRTVDVAGLTAGKVIGDAWLGAFFTVNGGQTWTTTLVPGYPQDQTQIGVDSPLHGFEAAADPTVRAGTNGMLYVSGIAFNRAAVPGSIPPADRASPLPARSGILGFLTRVLTGLLGRPLAGASASPPPASGSGVAFLARYIDDNNVDAASPQKIRYLDTIVIDNGGSQFIDKPFLAVDIPRAGASTCLIPARGNTPAQSFPGGLLHVVYAVFNKSISNTKLMYAQSSDCGQTWTKGTMIDQGVKISQGASIALDPNTGAVNVFWRLFGEKNKPDAIYFARSTDGGKKFSKPGVVAAFTAARPPFDQPTLPNVDAPNHRAFRTNTHPTSITDQFGRTYVAFTQRGWGPGADPAIGQLGDARVVITSAVCNATCGAWPTPTPVDNHSGRGHQFMPALALTSGQLALAWQDQRDSYGPKLMQNPNDGFGSFIADAMTLTPFHTSDVRLAFAMPGSNPAFTDLTPGPNQEPGRPSTRVSRYLFGFKPGTNGAPPDVRQLDFNPSNYPLFLDGTAPMIGDFIDVAPTTPFFRTPSGGWVYNTGQPAPLTSVALPAQVMTVWGDNRDVRPPANGNWTQYTPPTYSPPWATSSPVCVVGQEGMRNQNPYAAVVTSGFGMAAAGISKPVNEIQRAFVVTLENSTDTPRSFQVKIENQPPSPGKASFLQFPTSGINDPLTELTVNIPAHTTSSRSVFVTAPPSIPFTPITVRGSEIGGTLNSAVVLDSDSTNPPPDDPTLLTAESYDPIISSTIVRVLNPDFLNPDFLNPDFLNPDFLNPDFLNPDFLNPDFLNPDFLNPDFLNPDFLNPDFLNPDFLNATAAGDQVTSVEWTVTNAGNTTASYAFKPVLQITPEEADRYAFLLFVSRIYQTPFVENCKLTFRTHTQHLAVIPNPDFLNPDFLNPDFLNPDFLNPDFLNPDFLNSVLNSPISSSAGNTTLTVAPQETLRVTLLVRHDGSFNGEVATSTTAATLQQAINTDDAPACTDGNPATTCAPTTFVPLTIAFEPFDAGQAGTAYTESVSAVGGQQPYSWSALGLPNGLAMDPATGAVTGTPAVPGTFNVVVTVLDSSLPMPKSDVQQYALFIADPFAPIVVVNTSDSGPGSLRDAIVQANTTPASVIRFNIPGSGVHTITPQSPLPAITGPVDIDATTQPGYAGQPLIVLSGASAGPAANGLRITAGGSSVRGLAINGFSAAGIELSGSDGNLIEANYIGTNAAGTAAVPNNQGIVIVAPSANNTIGGTAPTSGNVISGNTTSGIFLQGGGNTGTVIERNIIGLDATGAAALGNGTDGIRTLNAGAQIYRNFISASNVGISLSNSGSTYSSAIEGNYIGTDITGMLDRGNDIGVAVGSSPGTSVGGTTPGAGNVISGNQTGVYIFAGSHQAIDGTYNALVQGNIIGMDASLSSALGNNVGVRLNNSDNLVGGTSLAAANVIAGNNTVGVTIHTPGTLRNRVLGNAILSNGGLGIDLDDDGPTPNDAAPDADAGANNLQNFPTLSSVTQAGGSTTISGFLITTPNTSYTLQFFWGPAGTCDPSGLGEGSNLIGTRVVTTDAAGAANFIYSFNSIPNLSVITATATDSAGNTSEFGPCLSGTVVSSAVVNNTSDSGPGSLRNAIQAANGTLGVTETITFNIPGSGVRTITLTTPLPIISDPVDINGTTQPGYSGQPLIEINGALAGPAASGFIVTAGGSSIRGLIVNRFGVDGIVLQTGGSNVVAANYVGTTAAGTAPSGNGGNAIAIIDSANNIIGGVTGTTPGGSCTGDCNLLVANSASSRSSVSIESVVSPATANQILGNFMGIDVTGTVGLAGNSDFAMTVNANGTIIGNGTPAGRNVVGGNNTGIAVSGANGSIRGNYVGTNSAGTARVTTAGFNQINGGIVLSGGSNSTVEGNLVSGNDGWGVVLSGLGASSNVVRGNFIGLNAAGTAAIANGSHGVLLFNQANNNTIGGTTPAQRNIISGNVAAGVALGSDGAIAGNQVIGNYIGTDVNGINPIPNAVAGVLIDNAQGNFIGGTLAGEGNLIAFNNGPGVAVLFTSTAEPNPINNRIVGNSMRANGGLGIDLGTTGVTANDALDADAGPNQLQNFPVLTSATTSAIGGGLHSSANTAFVIHFFLADADVSGHGEGRVPLGSTNVTTNGSGDATFLFGIPLSAGQTVTAVAVDPSGNTSEFASNLLVADPLDPTMVTTTADSGMGSLRNAIDYSNATPGFMESIRFNIPGTGPHTIAPATPLPTIADPVEIDGNSQPGFVSGSPVIKLDGTNSVATGLDITAGNSRVRGLQIVRFTTAGIKLRTAGNNFIDGNFVGTDVAGAAGLGNGRGIDVSTANNTIGGTAAGAGNVISGNVNEGLVVAAPNAVGVTANVVQNNRIGTNAAGTAARGNGLEGIVVVANSTQIGGTVAGARNLISGNGTHGIRILTHGVANIVEGNYIGTDVTGTLAIPNTLDGVVIQQIASQRLGGAGAGNVISGNGRYGVSLDVCDTALPTCQLGNDIKGNFIGTTANGLSALPNAVTGLRIYAYGYNRIGGVNAGEGNLISGNGGDGIHINDFNGQEVAVNNAIQGNFIGTDATGLAPLPNGTGSIANPFPLDNHQSGIYIQKGSNTFGGVNPAAKNVIAFNILDGVQIDGGGSNNVFQNNFIGIDATGINAAGNGNNGISILNGATANTIGTVGAGNVISANADLGVELFNNATNNTIAGNLIGLAANGLTLRPNDGDGIGIFSANSTGNLVDRNIVKGNVGAGVRVGGAVQNRVTQNQIAGNTGLGIELDPIGVTANDAGDADTGSNTLQNFPVLTNATPTVVQGHLSSTPSASFIVQFFSSATCDPSGFGEGEAYLGQLSVSTDGSGNSATFAFGPPGPLALGSFVTATATSSTGNTSEFSQCRQVTAAAPSFLVTNTSDSGAGSLRQAITDAEATPAHDTITFNIPGPGPHTIVVGTFPLPPITPGGGAVTIDGTSQPGYAGEPLIELDGAAVSVLTSSGLAISAGGSTVRGLIINRFPDSGIRLSLNGSNTIVGNWIGLAPDGLTARGNLNAGIAADGTSHNNIIGGTSAGARNVISGNNRGVLLWGGTGGNLVHGNYIGTNKAGIGAVPNTFGVSLEGASTNIIGGTTAAARNVISGNTGAGILIDGTTAYVTDTSIIGNYVGVNAAGSGPLPNGVGIRLESNGATFNTIGGSAAGTRNVISGNAGEGIVFLSSARENTVKGNYIGTGVDGVSDLGNGTSGIVINGGERNFIGGLLPGEGNVVSANGGPATGHGIEMVSSTGTAFDNRVEGNRIGTTADGTTALANFGSGVHLASANGNIVSNNLISGNQANGLLLEQAGTSASNVSGNVIGLDATGTLDLGNGESGIRITAGAHDNSIGSGGANVIAGNTLDGIRIDGTSPNNLLANNVIGTDAGSTLPLGNSAHGIRIENSSNTFLSGNLIANNALNGITVLGTSVDNRLNGDLVRDNGGLGIDLGGDGVTANDPLDADGGANRSQNFPVLIAADAGSVQGQLNSTASSSFRLDLYLNASCNGLGAPGGYGEGESLLGSITVDTDAAGNAMFVFSPTSFLPSGGFVTATATRLPAGDTSEFSQCAQVGSGGTFFVTSTSDSGAGSLRAAITNANLHSGTDTIGFNIPGAGPHTIAPLSNLPPITNAGGAVVIDGTTQPGYTGDPLIEIDGVSLPMGSTGLLITADGNTLRGLMINRFPAFALMVNSNNNLIEANWIGLAPDGVTGKGTPVNISIDATSGNVIGGFSAAQRNIISGGSVGVLLWNGASNNFVRGNYIGTNKLGTAAVANSSYGIQIQEGANNTIGGSAAGARNVISGNGHAGIRVQHASSASNIIAGNYIGLDAGGTAALPNAAIGIDVSSDAPNTIIGGATVAARNVISGNGGNGVWLRFASTGTLVEGNYIGTDAAGTGAVANAGYGIAVDNGVHNVLIGLPDGASSTRNVISGNGTAGVLIQDASDIALQRNRIGTTADGSSALANAGAGVLVQGTASSVIVGGTIPDDANRIASNGGDGISINVSEPITSGLVSWWPAGSARDAESANNGTLQGGAGASATGRSLAAGSSFSFDGVDDQFTVADTPSLSTPHRTVSLWVRAASAHDGTDRVIAEKLAADPGTPPASGHGWQIWLNGPDGPGGAGATPTVSAVVAIGGVGEFAHGDIPITVGVWHHVALTYDGVAIKLYVDGTLDASTPFDEIINPDILNPPLDSSSNLTFGYSELLLDGHFDGLLDDMIYIDRAVTIVELQRLAIGGTPGGVEVSQNEVFSNTGLGIDLAADGVTLNDAGDSDVGPNRRQNFPVISKPGANIIVALNSKPNTPFTLTVYENASCNAGPPNDYGEGEDFLGMQGVTTDGAGNASMVLGSSPASGTVLTATARGPNGTSEFSQCFVVP